MQSETLEPGVRRVTANNPSPMTFTGTQTYLLGEGDVCVIDPGPADRAHLQAILDALAPGERITKILVTHSHLDHSPLARPLADATGAPVLAAGPSDWGRSPVMTQLGAALGGGEGVDEAFAPDEPITEGDAFDGITVLETPGHMANHLSFTYGDALFSGDLVMGWSTSLVSPPDGDMTAFFASVEKLEARHDRVFYPGHGDPVTEPQARCRALLEHRRSREAQILSALQDIGPANAETLARHIYTEVAPALLPAAARNVLAHLIDLHTRARITTPAPLHANSLFRAE
ncbi:MBL fold metallo-hydrolase [Gymnodinialimonas ceratoperidinii]|uniref:MBL fold metallo-hydrolase n=1 Tax=Gymnodinialimonas ceratoperidinii TaxID=2856823 RepID=A0A8F6YBZ5_9RHOB|nr:MBL fold metallo-hydrolase [Gymnodinialimonas ceratoperidinii]QXT38740.1 MBL fold metallo-hydrolase [Gymnodinialimonas ceratoperidinii]